MRAKTWLLARFSSRVASAVLMELREFSEVSHLPPFVCCWPVLLVSGLNPCMTEIYLPI